MVYELAIELGLRSSPDADGSLRAAVRAALTHSRWEGPPGAAGSAAVTQMTAGHHGHVKGAALLPDGRRVAGGLMVIREEGDCASDWLDVYLDVEALAEAYPGPGALTFGPGGVTVRASWQDAVDERLIEMGRHIYAVAPFRLALLGMEASGRQYAAEMEAAGGIPAERWFGYLWPEGGELRWYPLNMPGGDENGLVAGCEERVRTRGNGSTRERHG